MQKALCLAGLWVLSMNAMWAGTVSFTDQPGTYFSFRNITETGALVPPSKLEPPTLITNPQDLIKFTPSAYVVVENNGATTETSVLSTQLALSLESVAGLALDQLSVSVAGTWDSNLYRPTGSTLVALSLNLDLVFGGVVRNLVVPITQNLVDKTWAGSLTLTQQFLNDNFAVPANGIQQLGITATPTVSATATYANARSAITYLDISAKAVPEPAASSLFLAGAAVMGLARTLRRRVR